MTTTTGQYTGPVPTPGLDDQAFWEGCRAHEFRLLRCKECSEVRLFGNPMCSKCTTFEAEPFVGSGLGTVWSWTTTYHPFHPRWKDRVPYNLTVVKLEEGPRFTTMVVDCRPEEMRIGMPVEVAWEDATEEVSLPKFRPAR